MSTSREFASRLRRAQPATGDRRWLFVAYDQLSDRIGPLAELAPGEVGIVLVETSWKAARRPYHRQKLALVLGNQRQFALEQAARGVAVRYVHGAAPSAALLAPVADELGPLAVMEPAERELRVDLAPLVDAGQLELLPHGGWLTTPDQFARHAAGPPWRMDAFYRLVRRETGILMDERGARLGGRFSFDAENRQRWRGTPPAAVPPRFEPDPVTLEVCALVEGRTSHPGRLDPRALPTTAADAAALWEWAKAECLPAFGPFEDAMSTRSTTLFHTRISALLHLHRLLPRDVVRDVERLGVPLQSREGFVRQVLGWREFVRHVHRATDGFRHAPPPRPGGPLPPAFWGRPSGLACLDDVVRTVWDEAWGHHITRLMVLANVATLLDVDARELTDWFWVAYADAFDWVVEPNVLGMGTFALGPLFTTKPYVSGAAYLGRMGDACTGCRFDPKRSCPLTPLYWAWLDRHADALAANPRMALPLRSLRRRADAQRDADARVFEAVRATLAAGHELAPGRVAGEAR